LFDLDGEIGRVSMSVLLLPFPKTAAASQGGRNPFRPDPTVCCGKPGRFRALRPRLGLTGLQ
jgi:hypothetical protein